MRTRHMLLTAALIAGAAGIAAAQDATTYDPAQLPAIHGKVALYSLTPRGDVDGLILADGKEVLLPPHLGTLLVYAVKPGDAVTVHGLQARAIPVVQAMSVTNDASGATVTDNGPPGARGRDNPGQALTLTGTVKAQLHGPQGEVNGILLDNGAIVRLPPPEAQRLAATLAVGTAITAQGQGIDGPLGRVVAAQAIGPDAQHLTAIAAPPPPRPGRPPRRGPSGDAMAGLPPAPPPPGAPPPVQAP